MAISIEQIMAITYPLVMAEWKTHNELGSAKYLQSCVHDPEPEDDGEYITIECAVEN